MNDEGQSAYKRALRLAEDQPVNRTEVVAALEEAIELGSVDAHVALAHWLKTGQAGFVDERRAFELMRAAADRDHAAACYNVGVSYENGLGTDLDLHKSFFYYIRGAILKDIDACYEVYRCLYYGIGTQARTDIAEEVKRFLLKQKLFNERLD